MMKRTPKLKAIRKGQKGSDDGEAGVYKVCVLCRLSLGAVLLQRCDDLLVSFFSLFFFILLCFTLFLLHSNETTSVVGRLTEGKID